MPAPATTTTIPTHGGFDGEGIVLGCAWDLRHPTSLAPPHRLLPNPAHHTHTLACRSSKPCRTPLGSQSGRRPCWCSRTATWCSRPQAATSVGGVEGCNDRWLYCKTPTVCHCGMTRLLMAMNGMAT